MFPQRALQASALQGLGLAATRLHLWGSLVAARRLLCSTPSDDFNREMAEFFGMTHPPGGSAASAGATASQPAAAAAGGQESGLVAEVQEFNAELFGVLGAPQQEDAAGAGQPQTVGQLAQRLAAAVGDGVQPAAGQAAAMQLSSRCSSSNGSFASSAGAAAVSINSSDDGRNAKLTHVDATGRASMVDVSHKRDTVRTAAAAARVVLGPAVFSLVAANQIGKGDVLTVAQLAGVMGAKHTATLIPLCHNILLSKVHVSLALAPAAAAVDVVAEATTVGPTGVEMEALTAAAVAALTVYDMCKAASKGIEITGLRLLRKSGGKSGDWERAPEA